MGSLDFFVWVFCMGIKNMNRRICSYLIYYFFYLCFFLFVLGWKWRRHFEQNEDLIGKYVGTSFKILTTGQTFTETIFTRFENTVSWKFERLNLRLQCVQIQWHLVVLRVITVEYWHWEFIANIFGHIS